MSLLLLISYTNIHKTQRIPKVSHTILTQNPGTLPIFFPLQPDIQEAHNSWTTRNSEYEIRYWTLNDIRYYLIANHSEEYSGEKKLYFDNGIKQCINKCTYVHKNSNISWNR